MVDINKKISVEEAKKIYQENNHRIVDENQDSFVSLKNINKIYPNNVQAVYDFNLDIKKNESLKMVVLWMALVLGLKLMTVLHAPLLITNMVFIGVSFALLMISYKKNQERTGHQSSAIDSGFCTRGG